MTEVRIPLSPVPRHRHASREQASPVLEGGCSRSTGDRAGPVEPHQDGGVMRAAWLLRRVQREWCSPRLKHTVLIIGQACCGGAFAEGLLPATRLTMRLTVVWRRMGRGRLSGYRLRRLLRLGPEWTRNNGIIAFSPRKIEGKEKKKQFRWCRERFPFLPCGRSRAG